MSEAESQLRAALDAHPLAGAAHRILGGVLAARGATSDAVAHLREAARLSRHDAEIHQALGLSLMSAGDFGGALKEFREALRIRPNWTPAMGRVAQLLAVAPDPDLLRADESIRLARRAVEEAPGDASLHEVLGTAYAAAGDFDAAVDAQETALDIAVAAGDEARAATSRAALERYRRREPPLPLMSTPR
jgi:Flp pilus assembly protein TadD